MARISEIFYLDETGLSVPDLDAVVTFMTDEFKNIYGADVVLTPDTQDGQWVRIIAQALHDTMNVAQLVYNSFSPSTALSDALDKNVRLNGIARKAATYSQCDVTITGNVGTIITKGQIKDTLNRIWLLPDTVLIPTGGAITVTAQASEPGAWIALPHTLTIINTPTRGWLEVDNDNEASAGAPVESDADLRRRQANSVALPSQSLLTGIVGAIATIKGVTRLRAYENDTDTTDSNGLPGHSHCVVVEGGDAQAIAETIFKHKTIGSGTYGDTAITVKDRFGLQSTIRFSRPTYRRIKLELILKPLSGYSNTYAQEIKDRVKDYVNNLGIGETVYIARLIPPILACNTSNTSTFDILSIKAAADDNDLAAANVEMASIEDTPITDDELITITEQGEDE